MTNEDMILLNHKIMLIHSGYSLDDKITNDYLSLQIDLSADWKDTDLEQARKFRDWLALEAFPETSKVNIIVDYKNQIEQLKTANERLRKAYDEIKAQNEKLAIRLFEKTEV